MFNKVSLCAILLYKYENIDIDILEELLLLGAWEYNIV